LKPGLPGEQRHVLVYSQHENAQPSGYPEIASSARACRTAVHAISLTANPNLENLCQLTQGSFQIARSEQEVAGLLDQSCLNLTARYAIRYKAAIAGVSSLNLRVQSAAGWGEAEIAIEP
jgi:hypothetical protein